MAKNGERLIDELRKLGHRVDVAKFNSDKRQLERRIDM